MGRTLDWRTAASALAVGALAALWTTFTWADTTGDAETATLPAFRALAMDGTGFDTADVAGRRFVMFFLAPGSDVGEALAPRLRALAELGVSNNVSLLGVVSGTRAEAEALVERHALAFPTLHDPTHVLRMRMRAPPELVALVFDAQGRLAATSRATKGAADTAPQRIDGEVRDALRLAPPGRVHAHAAGTRPRAPDFEGALLDGTGTFTLSGTRGRPTVLVFFLHTCPLCQSTLHFIERQLDALPPDRRPGVVGIEVTDRRDEILRVMAEQELDFLPVVLDPGEHIRTAYGVFAHVPDVFLIDAEGRIATRIRDWREGHERDLFRMALARLAGAKVPMLLSRDGFSGSERCGTCHELEYETWRLTSHSQAFDTLVKHGADANPECVGCHSVGFGQPGGFAVDAKTRALEDVGCENCHGRGGPHLTPGVPGKDGYESLCVSCHDPEHSLGFDFASFRPRISHAANEVWLSVPVEQRPAFVSRDADRERLPTAIRHVGSQACASCHTAQFERWAQGPHANALASLERVGQEQNADCLPCHTTGFERDGGFPTGGEPAEHRDLARVGCESCHGPGERHVGPDAAKRGTIVALTEKCDSCAILPVCGRCHDSANDPGFEFEVLDKIERLRHGHLPASPAAAAAGESAASPERSEGGEARRLAPQVALPASRGESVLEP